MLIHRHILLYLILLLSFAVQAQTILRVDQSASGTGDGTSWANAFNSLQAAIDTGNASQPAQIWLKSDTYYPTTTTIRTAKIVLKAGVSLYGGFVGTETLLDQRDWKNNETIISGNIGDANISTENTVGIITASGTTINDRIDGIILEESYENQGINRSALFISSSALQVWNCTFRNNYASANPGGALLANSSLVKIYNTVFHDNYTQSGGNVHIFNTTGQRAEVIQCLFYDNTGNNVVGLTNEVNTSEIDVVNNVFYNNTQVNTSNSASAAGITGLAGTIANNIFWNNSGTDLSFTRGFFTVQNNIIEGTTEPGNLNDDPLFIDPANGNFRIEPCSPAINAGDNAATPSSITTDFFGNQRLFDNTVDIGFYEHQDVSLSISAIESTDIGCFGESTGEISLNVSGKSPVEYSLDGINFSSDPILRNLVAGTYNVIVKDGNGCTIQAQPITLIQPPLLIANATITNVTCSGSTNGVIDLTISGGVPPYEINTGSGFGNSNTGTISLNNLAPQNYNIVIRDAFECSSSLGTITITEPDILSASISKTDITCNGANDGIISFTTSGGTGTIEASIDGTNFQISDFTGLAPNTHTITFRDANGCTLAMMETIDEPAALTATLSVIDLTCPPGEVSGRISVSASGGTAPYEYSIDGTNFQTLPIFSLSEGGSYGITIRDANGCSITENTTVSQPDAFVFTTVVTDISCNGEDDGSISVTAAGGTSPYEFSMDGTNFGSSSNFTALSPGTYTVYLLDANDCNYSEEYTIAEPDELTLTANFNGESVDLTAVGGTTPYEYSSDGTSFQTEANFKLANGSYTFTVKDGNGCVTSTSGQIVVTGTDLTQVQSHVEIYPNPATESIRFATDDKIKEVEILSVSGELIYTTNGIMNNKTIEVTSLKNGTYLLRLIKEDGTVEHKRFIKR